MNRMTYKKRLSQLQFHMRTQIKTNSKDLLHKMPVVYMNMKRDAKSESLCLPYRDGHSRPATSIV